MELKRRRFLQLIGAASVAPALPAVPPPVAMTARGSHAQMLWAGMAKKAGSAAKLAQITQGMGVSSQASVGVFGKLAQAKLVAPQTVANLARVPSGVSSVPVAQTVQSTQMPRLKVDVVKFLTKDAEDQIPTEFDDQMLEDEATPTSGAGELAETGNEAKPVG